MSKVKLDLRSKDFAQLGTFGTAHQEAMSENPNYLTPVPSAVIYDAVLQKYTNKLLNIASSEVALEVMRVERNGLRVALEAELGERGSYVQTTSGGDEARILTAAFQVQAEGTPTTSMPKPADFSATMGDNDGEIDVSCHAVPKAKSYVVETREHSDEAAPGSWLPGKMGTRSSLTVSGLVSGKKYGFRVRALGPNELESPWSDEVVCMTP